MALQPLDERGCDVEYNQFYDQSGGSMIPIFQGSKYQRGNGLGSIFSGLLKAAVPMLKRGAATLGRTALKAGVNVARDALGGKNIKEAFKDNAKSAGRELLNKSINRASETIDRSGSPPRRAIKRRRKRPTVSRRPNGKRKAPKRSRGDIFS